MKKKVMALATRPARTCGVLRKDWGKSAMPFFSSTRFSTGTRMTSRIRPSTAMGRAGEMPKMVKGHSAKGSMRPQAEMRDRPTRNRNRPTAAMPVPSPSNFSFSAGFSMAGSLKDKSSTRAKYTASTPKVTRKPPNCITMPRISGRKADRPDAAPMQPKASTRFLPW